MERGVNVLTNSQSVIVEGAEEAIEKYNSGEIDRETLYAMILDAPVVYVDKSSESEFKDKEEM